METILVTGGTGMIGKALSKALLEKNYKVIILSREPGKQKSTHPDLSFARWNIEKQQIDQDAIRSADHIIHLAGAGIADKRWTKRRKLVIRSSRVRSSMLLLKALKEIENNVKTVISMSAIGWYGHDSKLQVNRPFIETDASSNNFLGNTCKQWEESIEPVERLGKRLVRFRTGIVLSNQGGAIKEFRKPLSFGLATILGSGKQIMSWIHIDDLVRLFIYSIENSNLSGAYNAVAPNPVTNKELILQLAKAKNKFYIPVYVPGFVLKIVLGEMSIEVLKSATVSSTKIESTGFSFLYPTIQLAIQKLAGA